MSERTTSQRAGWVTTLVAVALSWACGKGADKPAPQPDAEGTATEHVQASQGIPVDTATGADTVVEILVFSSFQCPFCKMVKQTLDELKTTYGDKLRVTFMHQPLGFHKQARPAAIAAEAAKKQGKFWEMHDELFANQQNLRGPDLERYALKIGLDMDRFKQDVADPAGIAIVDRHQGIATAVGAAGTPYFFVNGKALRGAQEPAEFKKVIDEELSAAGDKKGDDWVKGRLKENNQTLFGFIYDGQKPPPVAPQRPPVDKTVYRATVDPAVDAIKGPADAPITLVIFSEFQCPYSKNLGAILAQLETDFPGKLRTVFKHSPLLFHKEALPASIAALCAKDQNKFWEMHDALWANQQALDTASLEKYAGQIGLDVGAFKACVSTEKYKEQVAADTELALKITARGTPTTFVNGRKIVGARPVEEFNALIDEELKKAEAIAARGIPANKLYDEIIKDGKVFEPLAEQVYSFKLEGAPLMGNATAKIQIVEFSDFQCPFCARVSESLKALKAKYGDDLVIAFKHFPLSFHREALPAAMASMCALEQDKFWEYHDQLFANMASLQPDNLTAYAQTVGLDAAKFAECVASNRYKTYVDADMAEARHAGVRGTPSLYINGRKFTPPGGYTIDSFTAVIDKYVLEK